LNNDNSNIRSEKEIEIEIHDKANNGSGLQNGHHDTTITTQTVNKNSQKKYTSEGNLKSVSSVHEESSVHSHLSGIYINVDDEMCVLKMNARMFKKQGITINMCKNRIEFLGILETISSNNELSKKNIKILMDHVLDRD